MEPNGLVLSWQTIPADILVLILKPLVRKPRFSYIPLICTHVCRHWRGIVAGTPSLWSFVDVGRGASLTQLWLSNSANSRIDVKLWQIPEEGHTAHAAPPNVSSAIENVKQNVERWRSLDISFWCFSCLKEIVFLGYIEKTIELDSLTIGPMGSLSIQPPIDEEADIRILLLSLCINLRPSVLRLDSFPLCVQENILSSRLTSIEVFAGATLRTRATEIRWLSNWNYALRLTPNLVSLALWHPGVAILERFSESSHPEIVSLPKLTHLSLNSPFLELSLMLARSPLGSLKTLHIESNLQSANVSGYIEQLASVAPHLTSLTVSNESWAPRHAKIWTKTFDKLQSLRELTLFEMSEDMALGILDLPNLPQTLAHVRLERIHLDRGVITWPPANWSSAPPKLTISGCNKWVDIQSEDGAALRICHGSIDKTKCKDLPGEAVLYDWETSLYTIREDLALVRAPSSASCFRDEDSSDELGETDDEGSSHDSGSEASFASGDLYIIEQGREQYPKSTYPNPSDSWVSTSESEVVSENNHNEEEDRDA